MNDAVELDCWTCGKPFSIKYGPGRPPRYCGSSCKNAARRTARRLRFMQRIEELRAARSEALGRSHAPDLGGPPYPAQH